MYLSLCGVNLRTQKIQISELYSYIVNISLLISSKALTRQGEHNLIESH